MKLPSGPGAPAPDITDILAQATRTCRGIRTFTAEIAVQADRSARAGRAPPRAGLAAPASARLEAVAPFGEPLFIFAATGNDATLLLPRDRRVLEHGPPDEVLEAIAGVPLGAADLRATLTGCTTGEADPGTARQLGDLWRVAAVGAGHDAYLHRDSVGAVASRRVGPSCRRSSTRLARGVPRLPERPAPCRSSDERVGASVGFDLQLVLSQVEINVALGPDVFRVQIPASTDPITLQELKEVGLLAPPRGKTQADRAIGRSQGRRRQYAR
jgi:hypothetical protein